MSLVSFLDYLLLERSYSQHTVTAYRKDIEDFSAFAKIEYDQNDIADVNYSQIRSWIISLVDADVSNRSINRKLSSLRSYFKFLQKIGAIETTPLATHRALKIPKKSQIPFSEIEVSNVFEKLEDADDFDSLRNLAIVALLYGTGMRRAELISLTIGSVDFNQKIIKVIGKRNKERYVPLLPSVENVLHTYLKERMLLGSKDLSAPLLTTSKGVKIYNTLVYRVINSYFSETSDKLKTSPHIVRHSFATHLLNQGADLNVVKELLGHASLASTQVYTHNSIKALRDVYSKAHPRNKK